MTSPTTSPVSVRVLSRATVKLVASFALSLFILASPVSATDGIGVSPAISVDASQSVNNATACYWPDTTALDAVVPIAGEDGSYASGVVINRNRILTAAHALSTSHRVFAYIDGQYRQAKIMLLDRRQDLAMLSVDTTDIVPLPVATRDPADNAAVWAVGFPRASSRETTSGTLLTVNAEGSLEASASIDQGQSGGGLLQCKDGSYVLAGMLRGYGAFVRDGQFIKRENHSVSVSATTIHRFFNAAPQPAAYSAAMVTR